VDEILATPISINRVNCLSVTYVVVNMPLPNSVKIRTFVSSAPRCPKHYCFLEGFQPSTVCCSGKGDIWMKLGVDIGGMTLAGNTEVCEEKPVLVPLCPPQISHGLAWDRTCASAVIKSKSGYTLVTLPCTVTPYRDNVVRTRDHITDQKLATR
jgi:hypothetical protein